MTYLSHPVPWPTLCTLDVAKTMDSVRPSTNEPLSAAAIARQTQECLDELKNLALG
jgi:hypothetical protein